MAAAIVVVLSRQGKTKIKFPLFLVFSVKQKIEKRLLCKKTTFFLLIFFFGREKTNKLGSIATLQSHSKGYVCDRLKYRFLLSLSQPIVA